MLNLTGTHVLPSPTDVLPNTTVVNVSLHCQVLNVGPKFTHSGRTEINTWAKVRQAHGKVKNEVAMCVMPAIDLYIFSFKTEWVINHDQKKKHCTLKHTSPWSCWILVFTMLICTIEVTTQWQKCILSLLKSNAIILCTSAHAQTTKTSPLKSYVVVIMKLLLNYRPYVTVRLPGNSKKSLGSAKKQFQHVQFDDITPCKVFFLFLFFYGLIKWDVKY